MLMFATAIASIVAAAYLNYTKSTGWYWFLLTGVMLFMMSFSFILTTQVLNSVDLSELNKNLTGKLLEKGSEQVEGSSDDE